MKKKRCFLFVSIKFICQLFLLTFLWTNLLSLPVKGSPAEPQRVTLDLKKVSLPVLFQEIEKQTSYKFFYNDEQERSITEISVSVTNETVVKVLDKVFSGTKYIYEISGNQIIVFRRDTKNVSEKENKIRILGKVTDEKGGTIPGVTVLLKGTTLGTATDKDGKYVLTLPYMEKFSLLFSFVGMESREIKYAGKDTINVVLKEGMKQVDEVVVTGYANIRKESFTGNAVTVTRDQLLKANNKNVIAALQLFDPSFRIRENSLWGSDPNALPEFNIRGESSIAMTKGLDVEEAKRTQRTSLKDNPNLPVFILDGFETSVEKIYDMDMNRIESITILKDAAATAMYGSRAANGVVVVSTVAPQMGEIRVRYSFNGGVELPDLSDYNLCNAAEKLEVERLMGKYTTPDRPDLQPMKNVDYNTILQRIQRGVDTDWLAQPLRNVFNHKHSISIEGGEKSMRYGINLNYDSNKGVMIGSRRTRAGAGLTLDFRSKEWLQIRNDISYSSTRSEDSPYGSFSTYAKLLPYYEIYDENGELVKELQGLGIQKEKNPLWTVKHLKSYNGKVRSNDITDNLNINLFILNGLQFKGQFSITKTNSINESFMDPKDPSFEYEQEKKRGTLSRSLSNNYNWNVNAMFYFNRSFGKHFINATAGFNVRESYSESTSMLFKGFMMGSLNKPADAADQPDKSDISSTENRLFGLLALVNYSYNDVYLLDVSYRLDGSSQFGSDRRFAPFWSFGAGINFHNYGWLKNNWLVNTLRIRASYGSTGKVNFPAYAAITTFQSDKSDWYYTGPANSLIYLGNPKLTWETTKTLDAGITVSFFNNKFYLSATYYRKKTEDLIDEVSVQSSSGFSKYKSNSGSILNKGFELTFNATLYRDRDWNVVVNANLASNKNKIVELGEASKEYNKKVLENYDSESRQGLITTPLIMYYEGASTTAIYAVRSAGIDPANGREKFIKKGGTSTYTWNANDQVVVGDKLPKAQGSCGVNVGFQGFYLNASFLYQWGAQTYNSTLLNKVENADITNSNVDRRVLSKRWIKVGDIAPFYDIKNTTTTKPTSRFVQDYDYLSFSSLSIGYDFNREVIKKIRLTSLGLSFNANDICRWSTVKEERGTSYPYARNYSFTVSVGF
ncbi:SusC/RagA family TonB-linked outer membrane protein [Gabonibacter chumensis]|uniref:SusC/RagA family TonB-linked outer membrane protein n=1 Tax=Gabonibacter chumensis TaxID=2972474 RepID=UPI0025743562|nr:SusC/RagA family TonB-linked outer membrane protein [Gabonibacter chumensis]MCR9012486.1 SusC/RagA family TonB-linked outer membrane protein [Gabonibacter chumensis]